MVKKGFTPLEIRFRNGVYPVRGLPLTGFTLLELMIAIILFAGAMVPLLMALNQGLFTSAYSEHRQLANRLALNEMEDRERRAASDWDSLDNQLSRRPIPGFPGFEREVFISNPPGTDSHLREVRVVVYWTEQEESSVSLVTYFTNNPDGSP